VSWALLGTIGGIFESPFTREAARWGFDGSNLSFGSAVEFGVHINRYLMVGARGGAMGGSLNGRSRADRARLSWSLFDASGLVRLSVPIGQRDDRARAWHWSAGMQLEGGVALAQLGLRDQDNGAAWIPRFGAQLQLGATHGVVALGMRVGYQHAVWSEAAGGSLAFGFMGLFTGGVVEVGL